MGQVIAFTRGEAMEYCTSQNATPNFPHHLQIVENL